MDTHPGPWLARCRIGAVVLDGQGRQRQGAAGGGEINEQCCSQRLRQGPGAMGIVQLEEERRSHIKGRRGAARTERVMDKGLGTVWGCRVPA